MGVLIMAISIGGLAAAAVLMGVSLITKRAWIAEFALGAVVIWFGLYGLLLFGSSLTSEEKELGRNEPKEFCGFYLDCHMHAAVSGVRRSATIGDLSALGEFYIVTVNVSSDARREQLGLLTVDAHVVDAAGTQYTRDEKAEAELSPQPGFDQKVGPGESFEKEIVFDLPAGVQGPKLDIREGYGIDHLIEAVLIGDEDSLMHKRKYFDLAERISTAAR